MTAQGTLIVKNNPMLSWGYFLKQETLDSAVKLPASIYARRDRVADKCKQIMENQRKLECSNCWLMEVEISKV